MFKNFILPMVFDNTPSWKTDVDGKLVLKDGNPVYLDSTGAELVVDQSTISKLRAEAKTHREEKEAALARAKMFEGIDPDLARKSIDLAAKIDAKKLIDAGEVDKVRKEIADQMTSQFTAQLTEKDNALIKASSRIENMLIDGVFSGSEFVRDNVVVPQDMFQAFFRNNFKVEDDRVVAYGKDGNRILSKTKAGEYAEPNEALQILVESHAQKDVILKASGASGSGSSGAGGARQPGSRIMTKAEFDKLSAAEKQDIMLNKHLKGEVRVI